MSTRFRLFGQFQVIGNGKAATFLTRPIESLCAYLAGRVGRDTSRSDVAEAIWPDADPEKAINRLRNALAHLRQALLPDQPVTADRLTVGMTGIDSDLADAEHLYRRSRIVQDTAEEREILSKLLAIVGRDFLEGWKEPWTEPLRHVWRDRRSEAALRLAAIALAYDEYDQAIAESSRAIDTDDLHEEAWSAFLRAMGHAGRHTEAVDRFRAARQRRLDELGLDFSPEMLDLAKRVAAGKLRAEGSQPQSTVAAREVMANVLDRQLREDPEAMLPLFSTPALRKEALREPLEVWKLVRSVIDRTEGVSEHRVKAMLLAVRLADMIDEYGIAFDYGEWLIENLPESSAEHRIALNMLGFISFELREWDEAWRYLNAFLKLAEDHGDSNEVCIAKSQMASLTWHQGNPGKAKAEYYVQLEILRADPSLSGQHNIATLIGNIGTVCATDRDWEEADRQLSLSYSLAVANDFDYVKGQVLTPLGLAKIAMGQEAEGRRLAALGLSKTYRSKYRRLHQTSADFAAGALAISGFKDLAVSVLDAYSGFRAEAHHGRSVVEEGFADWVRKESGSTSVPLGVSGPKVVALACDALEAI